MPISAYSYQQRTATTSPLPPSAPTQLFKARSLSSLISTQNDQSNVQQSTQGWRPTSKLPAFQFDTDDDVISGAASLRLRTLYDRIRSSARRAESEAGTRSAVREELDSFAKVLDGVPLARVGEHRTDNSDFHHRLELSDKLARSQNELEQLERLVDKTFGRLGSKAPINFIDTVPSENSMKSVSDHDETSTNWSESGSMAALAVRWAEERRRRVEREIASASYATDGPPMDLVTRSQRLASRQAVSIENNDSLPLDIKLPNPLVQRSYSTTVEPTRKQIRNEGNEYGVVVTTKSKPVMSEARRRVRAVLCKSKGDPHYFDKSHDEDD